jgi:hypothetical protein
VTVTDYFLPASLPEALGLLQEHVPSLLVMAGGTMVMPLINEGISLPEKVMGLRKAGLEPLAVEPVGGYFRLLARRLLNGLQFFSGGLRWVWFLPAAVLLVPPAMILPFLDFLDQDRNFTLGYICTARKPF